jgi:hypothetical protein
MNRSALYDDDILEWSEQQADALRRLAQNRRDLSNEVDWEHVAEEIEDVGRSELATVQSLTRQILIHLAKAVSLPDPQLNENWRKEAATFHDDLLDRLSASMLARIDIEKLWQRAIRRADDDLAAYGQSLAPGLSRACPLTMRDVADAEFDFIKTVEAVRRRLSTV